MIRHKLGCAVVAAAAFAGSAQAQVTPQDFERVSGLAGLFRANVQIGNPGPGGVIVPEATSEYDIATSEEAFNFISDEDLRSRFPTYQGNEAVDGVLDFRGVQFQGRYQANSNVLVISIPALGETLTFNGATRAESYQAFEDFLDEIDDATAESLLRRLFAALARFSPVDPIAGNPFSLQGTLVRSGLDLSSGDSAIESSLVGAQAADEPAWMIGVSGGHAEAGRFESDKLDVRVERSFRVMEGGRSRLKVELPVSLIDTQGAKQAVVGLAAGLEIPVIERRWSLEPRVAYGAVIAPDLGSVGHMLSTSVTSRLVFENVGRGHVVIGNMVGYTTTLPLSFGDGEDAGLGVDLNPEISNTVFRNGVAYQFPLKARFMGRTPSVRASYTHTAFTGDALFLEQYNDLALSFGVRGREGTPRNAFELLRLSANYVFGDDYNAFSLTLGYRF